jgi:hypothetical protein
MHDDWGLGFGLGWGDWFLLLGGVILAPLIVVELILPTVGFRLLGFLFGVPWRKVWKQAAPVAAELYRIYTFSLCARRIDRLFGRQKDRD